MSEKAGYALEITGASVANKVTAGGAATGVAGWASDMNWIGLAGVVVAILGLLVNAYFQARRDRREAAESAARIAQIQERCEIGR